MDILIEKITVRTSEIYKQIILDVTAANDSKTSEVISCRISEQQKKD